MFGEHFRIREFNQIRVDCQIRFEYATCGRKRFNSSTKNLRIIKGSDTSGRGSDGSTISGE